MAAIFDLFDAIQHSITSVFRTLSSVIQTLSSLNDKFQAVILRVQTAPAFPVPNSTTSFWLDNPPFPELCGRQDELQDVADMVIIGSGITAAAAARSILSLDCGDDGSGGVALADDGSDGSKGPRDREGGKGVKSVVVLEARDLCSGATERNGGHIKVVPYEVFVQLSRRLGSEKARDLTRFQMRHLDILREVDGEVSSGAVPQEETMAREGGVARDVKENSKGGDVLGVGEVREVETVDLFLEKKDFEKAKKDAAATKKWIPEFEYQIWEGEQIETKVSSYLILLEVHPVDEMKV